MAAVMSNFQVERRVREFARSIWGMEVKIPVRVNGRLTSTLGRLKYRRTIEGVKPDIIEIAGILVAGNYNQETIDGVLKHELCHLYMFLSGQPHKDGERAFENELKRIGASSTRTVRESGNVHICVCTKCGKTVTSNRSQQRVMRYTASRYKSTCCKAPIAYGGVKYIEDRNTVIQPQDEKLANVGREAANKVAQPEPRKAVVKVLSVAEIIQPGPKGVTNKQMIPALTDAINEGSMEKINLLRTSYPKAYEGTIRYLHKNVQAKLLAMV